MGKIWEESEEIDEAGCKVRIRRIVAKGPIIRSDKNGVYVYVKDASEDTNPAGLGWEIHKDETGGHVWGYGKYVHLNKAQFKRLLKALRSLE